MLPLGEIIWRYGIDFHCYTDDTQLYVPIKANNTSPIPNLETCQLEIKKLINLNFLLLNADKTELMVVGPADYRHQCKNPSINIDGCTTSGSLTLNKPWKKLLILISLFTYILRPSPTQHFFISGILPRSFSFYHYVMLKV